MKAQTLQRKVQMPQTPPSKRISSGKYDVCVIGGGASGILAAVFAARNGLSVLLLEKNKKIGTKLYATGNGRCNLANAVISSSDYYGQEFPLQIMSSAAGLKEFSAPDFLGWYFSELRQLGIYVRDRNGYYYPESREASSVVWALHEALQKYAVTIVTGTAVSQIIPASDAKFQLVLKGKEERIQTKHVILSVGSPSSPACGAADQKSLSELLSNLSVTSAGWTPALCPIVCEGDWQSLAGVRVRTRIRVGEHEETGELQITDYGLSGIVIFNLSPWIQPGTDIQINFLPDLSEENFLDRCRRMKDSSPDWHLGAFLNSMLPEKIGKSLIQAVQQKKLLQNMSLQDFSCLYQTLTNYSVKAVRRFGFDRSQASAGGILTEEVNPRTMELKKCPGLYVTGEALNVLGKCGGYNLMFAFTSGILAGRSVSAV